MTIPEQIRQVQRKLGLAEDGQAGPLTWGAIHREICGAVVIPPKETGWTADERSEKNIATLVPELQVIARRFLQECWSDGVGARIICGTRTLEEQAEIYAKGRLRPGPIVTHAKPGQSWHNFGLAFDIGIFEGRMYLPDSPQYMAAGKIGANLGLEWGGHWDRLPDYPHFQLRPRWAAGMPGTAVLAEFNRRHANGIPIV